jgi:hypothetical protein
MRWLRATCAAALLLSACAVCLAQGRSVVVCKAKSGSVMHYKEEGTLSLDAGGNKMSMEIKQTEKATITDVASNGNITRESQTESSETTVNGNKMPSEEHKEKTTVVTAPDGSLVSFKSEDEKMAKISARMTEATNPVFPTKPIGPGDKWSRDFKASDDTGTLAAHADFQVVDAETVNGVACLKLKGDFKETEGDHPISVSGTFCVEKSTGDTISADYEVDNLVLGDGAPAASGKMHEERLDGSPTGEAAAAATGGKGDQAKAGGAKASDTKPEVKKDKNIDETVKDYEKLPGIFTLYRKTENGHLTIYAEIKESQLDKLMMLEVTASTGNAEHVVAGTPLNDLVFKFVKEDDRLMLLAPNIAFRADEKTPIARAVHRSYADAYLEAFKIEAKQADRKSLLINISDFFKGDIAQISQIFSGGGGMFGGMGNSYSMDKDKTFITYVKDLPENLVVQTQYHFSGSGRSGSAVLADPRSIPIKIDYTLFFLPCDGYIPRLADARVGFFTTDYQSYDNDGVDDTMVHYIYRWRIEKADPRLALSPPKKPIVFWLDNAIPTEYREYVKEGLLLWNKGFEKVGIKDAIVVKQMPDDADWDTADMRYNTIRWVTSPDMAYAVAQFRVNPLTGEILNANITVDANFTRAIKMERSHIVDPATYFQDPEAAPTQRADPRRCDMAEGMQEQAWFGGLAISLLGQADSHISEKDYVHSFLREVVGHEMGHIMGLRHNFIASTFHSATELADSSVNASGVSASLMDYNPFNVFALKHAGVDYYCSTIGPYDMWAIEYGYTLTGGRTPEADKGVLNSIASRCNEPGHAYESDEEADQFDPAVVRFDLGSNPLAYYRKSLQVMSSLMDRLGDRVPKNGESYHKFTQDFERLLGMYVRNASMTTRYIGGQHLCRNFRGDSGEKPELIQVEPAEQRQALDILNTYVLSESAFKLPKSYFTHLTADPFGGFDISGYMGGLSSKEFPIRDQIAGVQASALRRLFSTQTLRRIANNEYKTEDPAHAMTLALLFDRVGATVWSELPQHRNIGALHRQLQRLHLQTMVGMVTEQSNTAPDDAKMLAWDQLRQLKTKIASALLAGTFDTYTRIHLAQAQTIIARALDAKMVIGQTGGGFGGGSTIIVIGEPKR